MRTSFRKNVQTRSRTRTRSNQCFENFKCQYETDNNVELTDQFAISDFAVKDEKKYFKHVLKLDKNFHVYIHGEKKYIRKGYDPDRDMNYYVLYFRNEE